MRFDADLREYAQQLRETADDPLMIGYFLMNEPTWGFAKESIAAGMLFNTDSCSSREVLAVQLGQKYPSDAALAAAWKMPEATFDRIKRGRWHGTLSASAVA